MASNLFGRYVWLIDLLRRYKQLTYEEINNQWKYSGLSYGECDNLAIRTFHNHRKAIRDIFNIYIECDVQHNYKYYIEDVEQLENDGFRNNLMR